MFDSLMLWWEQRTCWISGFCEICYTVLQKDIPQWPVFTLCVCDPYVNFFGSSHERYLFPQVCCFLYCSDFFYDYIFSIFFHFQYFCLFYIHCQSTLFSSSSNFSNIFSSSSFKLARMTTSPAKLKLFAFLSFTFIPFYSPSNFLNIFLSALLNRIDIKWVPLPHFSLNFFQVFSNHICFYSRFQICIHFLYQFY